MNKLTRHLLLAAIMMALGGVAVAGDPPKEPPKDAKDAKKEASAKQPDEAGLVDNWKKRVEMAKQVDSFVEYALYSTATGAPADKTVALVDALMEINPKSQYINSALALYLPAASKAGGAKAVIPAAQKVLKIAPQNEDALFYLAEGQQSGAYGNQLANVMRTKAKPEGVSDADWNKKKNMYMGHGLYWAGATACSDKARPDWMGCDKNLRAALPFMNDEATLRGQTLFFLGLANYNIFKLTTDRTKLNDAVKFSEQSAALSHPMQGQAATNAQAMKREAAAPAGRGR